ncbi:MAG TPA: DNA translocase FtsK 4TM domain-containing protein [Pirellulales bacterium]|jgi:S-DNA-T family DNA segregation ATPase FtsK/SpoIIIE
MLENRTLKRDLTALVLAALAIFLALSLATYDSADPPSHVTWPPQTETHNACGPAGAWAAFLLLEGLGLGAYFLAGSVALVAYVLIVHRNVDQPWLRGFGWVLAILGLTTLVAMAAPGWSPGPVIGSGGYVGATGRALLETHLASVGAYLVVASALIGGLLLASDYLLVRVGAVVVGTPVKGLGRGLAVASRAALAKRAQPADSFVATDLENVEIATEPNVRIRGKNSEETPEVEANAFVSSAAATATATEDEAATETEAAAEEAEEENSTMRVKPKRRNDRQTVMDALDAGIRADDSRPYQLPGIDLLVEGEEVSFEAHEKEVRRKAKILEKTFGSFGFKVKVVEIETGPVIAQFEVELEAGLRLSKITGLADDLAIALRVPSVRIVAPIPGKNTVGIEVPNEERQIVRLREVIEEANGKAAKMRIPVYLGKDVAGNPMVADLTTLPHLLIAGRTGTGKSVCLNTIIVSMLMTRRPDEVRMLMIDPKMVELSPYKTLPHLMHPVVTDMKKAEAILAWAVDKMEERYALLARAGVRHISAYNQLGDEELMERLQPENDEERQGIPTHLPYIVIVADEMADLMMTSAKEVETHIIRLAQKSRAVGIHLVLATQKPTVDVITGLIKSNLPARIAFQVASRTDSRVVLDEMGADKLLGNGDMLFLWPGTSTLNRGQGTYVSDEEINRVVDFVGTTEPEFVKELVQLKPADEAGAEPGAPRHRDELFEGAVDVVIREGRGSVSLLQRALGIGYGRAARLIDYMAEDGIVGTYNGSQAREVLITIEDWQRMIGEAVEPEPEPRRRNNKILPAPAEEEDFAPPLPATRPKRVVKPDPMDEDQDEEPEEKDGEYEPDDDSADETEEGGEDESSEDLVDRGDVEEDEETVDDSPPFEPRARRRERA